MYHSSDLSFLLDDADDPDVGEEEGEREGEGEGENTEGGEGRKRKISMISIYENAEKTFLENPRI
jgi:hypothetical protein